MKLLFVHDVKAVIYNGCVFARSYGYSVWKERYLSVFDHVKILTRNRKVKEDPTGKIDLLSGNYVEYDDRVGMFKGPDVFFNIRIQKVILEDIYDSDFVICRLDSFLGLIAIRECERIGKPYLIEVAGCAWDSFWNHGIAGKLIAPSMFLMMRHAIKNAKYVVYVTEHFLQKRYPTLGKNTNISNVKIFKAQDNILNKRIEKIKATDLRKKIILGTAANVDVRYKGQQYVIRALGELKKEGISHFEYQLPGPGDNRYLSEEAKKCGVEDQVVFLGPLTHERMMDWYQTIDIYVQPSLQEGLPRSVIEAMSYGIPCIGTNVAGIPELLRQTSIVNKKKIVADLCNLLQSVNTDALLDESVRNFSEAQKYDFNLLNAKRKAFFQSVIDESINKCDKKNCLGL